MAPPVRLRRPTPLPPSACARCRRSLAVPHPARLVNLPPALAAPPDSEASTPDDDPDATAPDTPLLRASLSLLKFYKTAISPILPKSCRFLPTCSEYAQTAYKRYGPGRGFLLTVWRLARCNPLGGSGYDPVQWPPPGWEWAMREK